MDDSVGVAAFLARNGAEDVNAYIRRRNGDTWEFVARLAAADLDEMVLQREYGGGTYEIRLQNQKAQFLGYPLRVSIAGPAKAVGVLAAPISGADVGMSLLLDTMKLQTAMLTGLMQSMAKPASITDTITALAPLLAPRSGDGTSVDQLGTFLRGIEFGKDLGSSGGSETPDAMTVAIEKLAVPLLEAVKDQRVSPAPRTTVRATLPIPSLNPNMKAHWLDDMRLYWPLLASAAVNHRNPDDIASPLLGMLPEHQYARIAQDVKDNPQFVETVVAAIIIRMPRLGQHQKWVTDTATAIRAEVERAEAGEGTLNDA